MPADDKGGMRWLVVVVVALKEAISDADGIVPNPAIDV